MILAWFVPGRSVAVGVVVLSFGRGCAMAM
jgi:hypothetical protein